jgi:hypothetical protein
MPDPLPPQPTGQNPTPTPPGVPVWSPEGKLVTIPALDRQAVMQGYRAASPEEVHEAQVEEQYGGFSQGLAAAAEGFGSALTGGLSSKLETASGLTTPEAIQGRKEAHPVPHAVGTGVGIAGPLLLTGGAAAPTEAGALAAAKGAAEFTAPALIARAGRGAAALAERAGLPGAVGTYALGATEGALYSGADVTEKALLGDPQLTWEKAASEMGLGAIFGGTLAGGSELAVKGLGKLLTKATEGLQSIGERITAGDSASVRLMVNAKHEIADLAKLVPDAPELIAATNPETAKFIIRNIEKIKEYEQNFPGLTDILARGDADTASVILKDWGKLLRDPQRRIEVGETLLKSTQSTYDTVEGAFGKFNREVRPEEAEALLSGPHTVELPGGGSALEHIPAEDAQKEGMRVLNGVGRKINEMRAEPDLFAAGYVRQLELFRDGIVRTLTDEPTAPAIFQRLRLLRQQLDGEIPWDAATRSLNERKAVSEFKELRTFVRDSITNGETWGQAGVRQEALDKAYTDYFAARKEMLRRLGEGTGTAKTISPTKVNAWVNAMADMRGKVKTGAFIDYTDAATRLAHEMETSGLQGAPAIRKQIAQAVETAEEIRQRAAVTQLVKMQQGHEILSSGPAVPTGASMALAAARRIPGGAGHVAGLITGTIHKVRQPSTMVHVLSVLDKFAKRASVRLDKSASAIFKSGAGGAASSKAAATGTEGFSSGGMVTPERFTDVSSSLRDYGGNLDRLAEVVSRETEGLRDHAPAATAAAHAFAARVVQHLGAQLPDGGTRQLLDPKFEPSRTELADYNRHHEIAARGPVAVLEHLARGTLHPAHLEASQAMYPRLHAEAQQLVADKLAEHLGEKNHLPSRLRPGLSMFLGNDLEYSMTPAAILSAQLVYAGTPAEQPPGGAPAPQKSRNVETRISERASTSTQGNEARLKAKA